MTAQLQNGYRLLCPLGAGGMGHVWLAEAQILGHKRRCALKFIQPEHARDPRYTERFAKEAFIGLDAGTPHPNVVTTRGAGVWSNGQPYVVMDYVAGPALDDVLSALAGDALRIRAIVGDVLLALRHLSAQGLVHRDLSPGNILLGPDGYVKVADFGLATRESTPSSGVAVGTLPYASPETMRGERGTAASDLYSVGMILQTLLSTSRRWPRDLRRLTRRLLATNPRERGTAQAAARLLGRGADRHAMAAFARAHAPDTARQHLDAFPVVVRPLVSDEIARITTAHRMLRVAAAVALGIGFSVGVHEWRSASREDAQPSRQANIVPSSVAVESRTSKPIAPGSKSSTVVVRPARSQRGPLAKKPDRMKPATSHTDMVQGSSDLWGLEIRRGAE